MIRGKLLLVVSGKDEREYVLEKQTVTLGRALDNDIVLPSPMISRYHAQIVFQPGPIIEDLGSTHGTIVGAEKITSSHPLHSGDIITVGDVRLRFELPHLEETAQPPAGNVKSPPEPESQRPAPQPFVARSRLSLLLSKFLSFLHEHTVSALAILFFVGMLLILANLFNVAQEINKNAAAQYAAVYVRSLDKVRALYSSEVVTRVRPQGIEVTADYTGHEGAIPVPATLGIILSQQISQPGSGVQARLYSDYPFPNRTDGGPHTDFEKEALVRLRVQSDKTVPFVRYADVDGRLSLQFAHAVLMEQSCVTCHNTAPESPKKDWKVGDVRGVQTVILPIDSAVGTIRAGLVPTLGVMLIITFTGLGLLAFVLSALRSSIHMLSRTNAAYTLFVPRDFLSLLGKQSIIDVALADNVQMEMTVLFSDIRSFTTISESMDPQKNFLFLSDLLSKMGPLIRQNHGFIDKYIGDAIMAVFESPDDAVDAAIALSHRLVEYNRARQEQGLPPVGIGVGLNTGKLTLGTLGERDRMDGTVIGDAVNLASRLEGLTNKYRVAVLISERTFRGLKDVDRFAARLIDRVRVKGKNDPVTIYEVFSSDPAELKEGKLATKRDFEQAIGLYQLKQFQEAKSLFEKCLAACPEDSVAEAYIERCAHFIEVGVDADWDGVLNLDSK